jgi:hypothetical protein
LAAFQLTEAWNQFLQLQLSPTLTCQELHNPRSAPSAFPTFGQLPDHHMVESQGQSLDGTQEEQKKRPNQGINNSLDWPFINQCPSINGQFARYRRRAKNLILEISTICLRLNFSRALISTKFAYFWMDTNRQAGATWDA